MTTNQKISSSDIINELEKNLALLDDLTRGFENDRSSDFAKQKTKKKKISKEKDDLFSKSTRSVQRKPISRKPISVSKTKSTRIRATSQNKTNNPFSKKNQIPSTDHKTKTSKRIKSYNFKNPKTSSKLNKSRFSNMEYYQEIKKKPLTSIKKRKTRSQTFNQKINNLTKDENSDRSENSIEKALENYRFNRNKQSQLKNRRSTRTKEKKIQINSTELVSPIKAEFNEKKNSKTVNPIKYNYNTDKNERESKSKSKNQNQNKNKNEREWNGSESESDEDLEIDFNFAQIVKSPTKSKYYSRNKKEKLKFLDKNIKQKVLKHKELKEEENINLNELPDFNNTETIDKISHFTSPQQPQDRLKEFEKFISQFDLGSFSGDINISDSKTKTKTKRKKNLDTKEIELKLSKFKEKEKKKAKEKKSDNGKNNNKNNHNKGNANATSDTQNSNSHSKNINDSKQKTKTKSKGITLITKDSIQDLPQVQGKMKYNEKKFEWEGNDEELDAFEKQHKSGFIPNTLSSMTFTEYNQMKYNPLTHTWEGNEEAIDWGDDDEENSFLESIEKGNNMKNDDINVQNRYQIGRTFELNKKIIDKFKNSEKLNNKLLQNWNLDEKKKDKTFLIRKFALIWMIESGKNLI
ncbi:morphogenesis protein sog2 [Anaeramoeba flamelloides]|uniref:Morphogenesis protein sog2 n=1 Tax=Anaeramoeba flamelloides TaxID=1746091 RepID=A0AAV7ZBF8_9EUKA|nr:morphogenesis protein sog2 [Anaeramoeba flamelloides]